MEEHCSLTNYFLRGTLQCLTKAISPVKMEGLFIVMKIIIIFHRIATVTFCDNKAKCGGAVYSNHHSRLSYSGESEVTFSDNEAQYGGVVYSKAYPKISFDGSTTVTYERNKASTIGGAVFCRDYCSFKFDVNSNVTFSNNEAQYNGALFTYG